MCVYVCVCVCVVCVCVCVNVCGTFDLCVCAVSKERRGYEYKSRQYGLRFNLRIIYKIRHTHLHNHNLHSLPALTPS